MSFLDLLIGTVLYRPYVYLFFFFYVVFGIPHLGFRKWSLFTVSTYLVAFISEYNSIRNGIPFGLYTYIDTTKDRELWIGGVPFWDSLSFVFLSYFSMVLAAAALAKGDVAAGLRSRKLPWIGGLLMMLLDVVIDPITLQGEKWFLGEIYYYPNPGFYFDVTFANFVGWFVVGFVSQWIFQQVIERFTGATVKKLPPLWLLGNFGVYIGVFAFMIGVTVYVGEYLLATASTSVALMTCLWIWFKGVRYWRA